MGYRLPPLSTLRLFEAAGRLRSFKEAAEEVHLTPSAVSHGIQTLEEWLGVTLFIRGSNGLTLTLSGESYLPYVTEALALLARGTLALPGFAPRGKLSISCAPTFAMHWLTPRLQNFLDAHPAVSVSVDTRHKQVEFPLDGVDIAIRKGRGAWAGLSCTKLTDETLVPVASPAYLERVDPIRSVADLRKATLIHVTSITEDWPSWLERAVEEEVQAGSELRFDAIHLAMDAALQGLGIAIGRRPLIDRELEAGRLVKVLGPEIPGSTSDWLVCTSESASWPEIAAFRDWIVEELRTPADDASTSGQVHRELANTANAPGHPVQDR